jgi:hypothetical protein
MIYSEVRKTENDIASVYDFFADCTRIGGLISMTSKHAQQHPISDDPEVSSRAIQQVKDVKVSKDQFSFIAGEYGKVELRIEDREEPKMVKYTGSGLLPFEFCVWVNLESRALYDTRIQLVLGAKVNMVSRIMMKRPLEKHLNLLMEMFEKLPYSAMNGTFK